MASAGGGTRNNAGVLVIHEFRQLRTARRNEFFRQAAVEAFATLTTPGKEVGQPSAELARRAFYPR